MLDSPRYVSSSFALNFERQPFIRRRDHDFEDILKNKGFLQPQIIPISDELGPEVPRMIFSSLDGLRQIIISQLNITLNLGYPDDWQDDVIRCKERLLRSVQIPFELLKILGGIKPFFVVL